MARHVGAGQIQAAYRFARSLYSSEGLATYGLLDAEERAEMLTLVERAYATLSDPGERRDHDLTLLTTGADEGPEPVVAPPPKPSEKRKPVGANATTTPSSPTSSPSTPAPTPLKVPEFVDGAALRTLREARGLSIDQIAALSKVGSRFLRALEEDRHQVLPARVFARGFLIEYARALGVSETQLAERYLRHWSSI